MLFLGYVTLCAPVYAIQQNGITLTLVGSEHNGSQAYIGISPNSNGCLYGGVYYTNPSEVAKTLSVALAAKLTAETVRMDFTQLGGTGTHCYGYAIYIE